ncbi:MAG: hypothetical protein WA947_04555, partial [Phormidesmis sp.]
MKRQPASGINKHATQKALQQSPEQYIVALTNSKNGYDANQYTGTQPKSRQLSQNEGFCDAQDNRGN